METANNTTINPDSVLDSCLDELESMLCVQLSRLGLGDAEREVYESGCVLVYSAAVAPNIKSNEFELDTLFASINYMPLFNWYVKSREDALLRPAKFVLSAFFTFISQYVFYRFIGKPSEVNISSLIDGGDVPIALYSDGLIQVF